ncbi:aspartate aminotransferase family protein [Rhodococcus ruber]|nr:aspartate aminotransferase family protein [Rhodococcus ruber]
MGLRLPQVRTLEAHARPYEDGGSEVGPVAGLPVKTVSTQQTSPVEVNGFAFDDIHGLPPQLRGLVRRRRQVLGSATPLLYRTPLHPVAGSGVWLEDGDGNRFLDMYNNVASVGHCHPRVTAAVTEQLRLLNTHTRYLHDGIVDYAEDLLGTFPDPLAVAMFTCTGSEANDLALQLARQATGRHGIVVTESAYHGNTTAVAACSPSISRTVEPWIRVVPAPNAYRVDTDDLGAWFAAQVAEQIHDLEQSGYGFAALLVDTVFSSDGILPDPAPFLKPAADVVRGGGGLLLADEVQPGFGRLGHGMWGFRRHDIVPDIVTLGKPMGNGMPVAATITSRDVVAETGSKVKYFNTFGGNPVSMAAAQAVLDVIRDEQLIEVAHERGAALRTGLRTIGRTTASIGDVRGAGLFLGVEIVADADTRYPDADTALTMVNRMRDRGILISVAGAHGNVLKIRPPLPLTSADVDHFLDVFARTVAEVTS